MEIYQYSCIEGKKIDPRQANAILIRKPDIIFREAPGSKNAPALIMDPDLTINERKKELKIVVKNLNKIAKKYPWVASDVAVYNNIFYLQNTGHNTKTNNIDADKELLVQSIKNKWNNSNKPRKKGVLLLWWVYIYLREKIMTKNIAKLIRQNGKAKIALALIQKFHWQNIKFQLTKPTKDELWKYYFGKFNNLDQDNITKKIKTNAVLYKYWRKYSDFN